MLAAYVLTGNLKHLLQKGALRTPKLEDMCLAEYVSFNASDMPSASCLLPLGWYHSWADSCLDVDILNHQRHAAT